MAENILCENCTDETCFYLRHQKECSDHFLNKCGPARSLDLEQERRMALLEELLEPEQKEEEHPLMTKTRAVGRKIKKGVDYLLFMEEENNDATNSR